MPAKTKQEPVTLDRDYLTLKQAAEYLHVSTQTIHRWIDAGTLTSVQLAGPKGKHLIPTTAIEKLLGK